MLRSHRGVAAHVGKESGDVSSVAPERYCIRVPQYLEGDAVAYIAFQQIREPILQGFRPEQRAQPCCELALVERFREKVVGTRLQAAGLVFRPVECGEKQDRQTLVPGQATDPLADLDT